MVIFVSSSFSLVISGVGSSYWLSLEVLFVIFSTTIMETFLVCISSLWSLLLSGVVFVEFMRL